MNTPLSPPIRLGSEKFMASLTPREIVAELDRYIVGQDKAKRAVAIALRNRWRRHRKVFAVGPHNRCGRIAQVVQNHVIASQSVHVRKAAE